MGTQKLDRINSLPSPPKQDRSKRGATLDALGEWAAIQISDPDEMLCPRDAAQLLAVGPKTLVNWRWQKRGPAYTKYGTFFLAAQASYVIDAPTLSSWCARIVAASITPMDDHDMNPKGTLSRYIAENASTYRGRLSMRASEHATQTADQTLGRLRWAVGYRGAEPNILHRLEGCSAMSPCLSSACARCTDVARLLFVNATMRLLGAEGPSNKMVAFTIVPSDTHFTRGSLSDLDMSSFKGRISRAINSTCAGMVISAVEVALNQTHDGKCRIRWVPHVHGLVVVPHVKKFKRQLKAVYPKSDAVPRPIKITKWDGDNAWLSYCFSLNFDGRVVRQQAVRFDKATQTERICRTTSSRRLSADEFVELLNFLDIQPLEARLLLRKVQLRYSPEQPKLVPIIAGL